MVQISSTQWGPESTPRVIQKLIFITCAVALFSALTEPLFTQIFGIPGLPTWLSLSWYGIQNYFLWQPITYLFVLGGGSQGIDLFFLISLFFDMYILWIMGTEILNVVGSSSFLRFYFLSGLFAGLTAVIAMYVTGQHAVLAGPMPSLLALFTVWAFYHPETELLLFFLFPMKVKWLFPAIFFAIVLINLSQLDWIHLVLYLTSIFFGYVYAIVVWEFSSPFPFTEKFDHLFMKLKTFGLKNKNKIKIFDIKTGEPLVNDEEFIDAMLAKISRYGENSLTRTEKRRMQAISEQKRKPK